MHIESSPKHISVLSLLLYPTGSHASEELPPRGLRALVRSTPPDNDHPPGWAVPPELLFANG